MNGRPALHFFSLLAALTLFNACNVTKHLDESKGERLLIKNSIDIKAEPRLGFSEKAALQYELGSQYKQQPNRRSWPFQLFQRRVWLFHKYKSRTDKSKFARWIIKRIAEPPAIYEEELTIRTAKNFQNQMQQRGYFNAQCHYKVQFTGKHKVKVKYNLNLGRQYTIDGLEFMSRDTFVQQVMRETAGSSLLKPGVAVSALTFEAEKTRITSELRNRGLAFFTSNFIEFTGDTSKTRTCVTVEVLTPTDSTQHRQYFLDDITVFEGLVPDYSTLRSEETLDGVTYFTDKPEFQVKPFRLKESLFFHQGERYKQSDFDKTARNLNALGVFRFVAIRPVQDSLQRDKLDVGLFLTPNKRYAFGWDADLNSTSSSNALTRNLLGLSTSLSFRNRNVMGGAENLQTDLQYNVEFNIATRDRFIFSQEIKFQNQLSLPRFFDYFGFWKTAEKLKIGRMKLLPVGLYQRLKEDAQSRITVNANYLELFDFYKFNLINASYGFDIRSNEHQHSFNHIGIDILRP
ncbi:MAG: hypothetical protein IT269_02020, partial [Saprospiraceae bacterium]|nr:hypothetical protein [Saprospiraceae bacterium]